MADLTRQQKLDLVKKFGAAARLTQQKYGVPASVTIAQAILESGWGRTQLAMKPNNNYFGIKDTKRYPGYAEFPTTEVDKAKGRRYRITAHFETYDSMEQSFEHHALLLSQADRYQPAMDVADDPAAFILQLLACGYSTNPQYPKLLADLIRQYNLTRFDNPAQEAAQA